MVVGGGPLFLCQIFGIQFWSNTCTCNVATAVELRISHAAALRCGFGFLIFFVVLELVLLVAFSNFGRLHEVLQSNLELSVQILVAVLGSVRHLIHGIDHEG